MAQEYIVIETHGGLEYATIVMNEEDGTNKVFNNLKDAITEQSDCQDAIIISTSVNDDIVNLSKETGKISAIITHHYFDEIRTKINNGVMAAFEIISNWAWEFNTIHANTLWEDSPTDWEETICMFIQQKLKN